MNDELKKNFKAEHERHGKAVAKAIDEFKSIDEFGKALDDEHQEHLEKCMKAIDDSYETMGREPNQDEKSIDQFKEDMKAEHLTHVKTMDGHVDAMKKDWPDGDPSEPEVQEESQKAIDEFTTKAETELDRHEKAHDELLDKHTDESDDDEEKAFTDLIQKAGRVISKKNKEKLKAIVKSIEDHHTEHAKFTDEVTAAIKELIGSEDGDGGEEPSEKPEGETPEGEKALNKRSSTSGASAELEGYLLGQRLVRQVKSASEDALRQFKEKIGQARASNR